MKKILIIDDDQLVRESVRLALQKAGYITVTASGANEALSQIGQNEFDLIVSDIRMPGKNGVETIRAVQTLLTEKAGKELPIIFITGYADVSDELNAEILGEVILKPFDLQKLIMTIREYL